MAGEESDDEVRLCPHCGQPEVADLLEVWLPRDFMLDTCCEGMHDAACAFLAEEPKRAAEWLHSLGLAQMVGQRARRVVNDAGHLIIDWNLELGPIPQRQAKAFIAEYHRNHKHPPPGWHFGACVRNGRELIAVTMVGRPVSRMINKDTTVEVNRVCVRDDLCGDLVWNACSMLYGYAAREAKRRGFKRAITYTRVDESGASLEAAGWVRDGIVRGRSWNAKSRPREDKSEVIDKVRWVKELGKKRSGLGRSTARVQPDAVRQESMQAGHQLTLELALA